jgi:hypothetical protein
MKKSLIWLTFAVSTHLIAQPVDVPVSGAQPKTFSVAPNNLGFLENSVNLFSGQVSFSVPVYSIQGKGALSYALSFNYSSANVKWQAETWNRESPTGPIGLGWSIDMPRVVVDHKGTGTREDDHFYLVEGGATNRLYYDGLDGSEWKFYTKSYMIWKIRYNPSTQKWTITKEDGSQYVYGDQSSARNTIQYIVKWGNWIGASSLYNGNQQMAYIWNLSEIVDVWGDKLLFRYDHDGNVAGGNTYTQASYLSEIRNSVGEKIALSYGYKLNNQVIPGSSTLAREFKPYHNSTAYQDKYEVKYLDKVAWYDQNNTLSSEYRISYDFMGSDELAKRLLNSITRTMPNGEALQPIIFEYEKNTGESVNSGVLKKVTSPEKGTVEYTYTLTSLPGTSRDFLVQPVASYYEPRFWFGSDFIVVSRRNCPQCPNTHPTSAQPVLLDVYTWEGGKWIAKNVATLLDVPTKDNGSFKEQDFQLVVGPDFFASINYRSSINKFDFRFFKKNDGIPGEWHSYYEQVPGFFEPRLHAGDDFVLIGGKKDKMYIYEWNGTAWSNWNETLNGGDWDYYFAAAHNYFIVHNEDRTATDVIKIYFKDRAGVWQNRQIPSGLSFNAEYSGDSYWYAGPTYAVAMANDNNEFIYTWDESFNNFQRFDIGFGVNDNSPVAFNSSMVLMTHPNSGTYTGYAFRYNGQTWRPSGPLDYFGQDVGIKNLFSISEDFVFRPFNVNFTYVGRVRIFDPSAGNGSWGSDVEFPGISNNYASIAGFQFFMYSGRLYFRNPDNSFSGPVNTSLSMDLPSFINGGQPVSAGSDYIAHSTEYSGPGYLRVYPLRNGIMLPEIIRTGDDEGLPGWNQSIDDVIRSAVGFVMVPSPQVGGNSMVTILNGPGSGRQQNSDRYKLYRKVGNHIAGALSGFVATMVKTNDGLVDRYTSYEYDVAMATADVSGTNFQFNKVTVVPGSNNPGVRPFGYSVSYFLNGKSSTELTGNDPQASYPAIAGNMASFYGKLLGYPYKSIEYNSSSAIVSKSSTDYNHYYYNQYSNKAGFFVRPWFQIAEQDGIKTQKSMYYYTSTYQLQTETVVTLAPPSTILQTVTTDYSYWWQSYDLSPPYSKNLLTPLINVRKTVDGAIVSSVSNRWKLWGPNNTPAPFDSYEWVGPSLGGFSWDTNTIPPADFRLTGKITIRESSGTAVEQVGNADQVESVILDNLKRRPFAKVANAGLSDVAYCGFEDTSTGNFSWSDGTIASGSSKTGGKYFLLGTNGVSKGGLSQATGYKISFWAKSNGGQVSLSGVNGNISLGSLTNWTLFEFTVSAISSMSLKRIGATEVQIDDVRIHPSNARMTTYTYHPVFGATSETTPDQRTLFTEYDTFGRPKFTRDEDNNIRKHSFVNIKN